MQVREAQTKDAGAIAAIYNHYIRTSIATFEEQPVSSGDMAGRISALLDLSLPWLVADDGGQLLGYCYAGRWKNRGAYRHTAECAVYVDAGFARKGVGSRLYQSLFEALKETTIHTVIGGIAQPNPGCVALHEKFGFSKVAHFKETGYKFGRWIDVAYWQKPLQ